MTPVSQVQTETDTARLLMSVLPLFNRVMANELRRDPGETTTISQFRALAYLDEQPMTVSALARLRRVSMQSASDLAQGLVERGWAVREPDASDRRQMILRLTETGRAEYQRAQDAMIGSFTTYLHRLSGAELTTVEEALRILQGMLRDQEDGNDDGNGS